MRILENWRNIGTEEIGLITPTPDITESRYTLASLRNAHARCIAAPGGMSRGSHDDSYFSNIQ